MAILEFLGYNVEEVTYRKNKKYNSNKNEINMPIPDISAEVSTNDDQAELLLNVIVGSLEDSTVPFEIRASIKGLFKFNNDEDEQELGFNHFLKVNAVAIMYPYIRALVSLYTNSSNEFPGYNMPTLNVVEALSENKND